MSTTVKALLLTLGAIVMIVVGAVGMWAASQFTLVPVTRTASTESSSPAAAAAMTSTSASTPAPQTALTAQVISVQPHMVLKSVPYRSCRQVPETVYYRDTNTSGAGAVVGGIAGGLLGNTVGQGGGRTAATIGGVVLGGLVGNEIEKNNNQPQPSTYYRTVCRTKYTQKSVQSGYDVTYIYNGVQKTITMPNAPAGDTIPLSAF